MPEILTDVMYSERKIWTSTEEDIFLRIWQNNLVAMNNGKSQTDVCKEVLFEFRDKGMYATLDNIKSKMQSFKRKYNRIIRKPNASKQWIHMDRMAIIMEYPERVAAINFETEYDSHSSNFNVPRFDDFSPRQYAEVQVEIEDMRTSFSRTTTRVTFEKNFVTNDSTIAASRAIVNKPGRKRRCWGQKEEVIFLDVWKKYFRDLASAQTKLNIYKKMAADLKSKGVQIRCYDVNSKMQSFIRKFCKESNIFGNKSKWVHYANMRKMLGPAQTPKPHGPKALYCPQPSSFEYFTNYSPKPNFIDCSNDSFANDNIIDSELDSPSPERASYYNNSFTGNQPIDTDNEKRLERANENELGIRNTSDQLDNAQDACSLIYPESLAIVKMEEGQPMEQPINLGEAITRPEQIEQFGSFITKELNLLNDDLLEEAKARISDIMCIMRMKQAQQNTQDN
ncbi:uncharacterized protein LOC108659113 [Drosophila navojoa]|uniref:uncharacterized protein LOC108659113 n=1 Tax=Drosophila navojoa TaxID=7232 RepID=UPI000846E0F7|nr:uncharacterized protein LOC108659113 [Drosophila navojoa]